MPARKNYNKNYRRRNGSHKKDSGTFQLPLKVSFLGGLNEIGKNMTLFEYDGDTGEPGGLPSMGSHRVGHD